MSLPVATGGLSLAENYLAATLAGSATFQTLVGAAGPDEATKRIRFDAWPRPIDGNCYTPEELAQHLPNAMIFTGEASGYLEKRLGFGVVQGAGSIMCRIERVVPPELMKDDEAIGRDFKNILGAITGEMHALAYTAGYLVIDQILVLGPWRVQPNEEIMLDTQLAELTVIWGGQG